jgi:hypothetical protein
MGEAATHLSQGTTGSADIRAKSAFDLVEKRGSALIDETFRAIVVCNHNRGFPGCAFRVRSRVPSHPLPNPKGRPTMSINIGPPAIDELRPRITVIGVGGAGGNAIANMITAGIEGVDFVVANTDAQALNNSIAENRIQLGPAITQGLGAGARPEVGRAAAEETLPELERVLDGVHMVFIAAGMGGAPAPAPRR